MRPAKKIRWAFFFLLPFLFLNPKNAFADDYTPDVTARVARISFLQGDVQIRRADGTDWERAAQNLPIVEGDEIATDSNARLEIQFDSYMYLRLSENAYLKITTLRDEGIAVSLPEGTLSARVLNFDKDRAYFEIDAPKTTVAVERVGMYRVDAGSKSDSEIRVSVTDDGQAQVYSETSGFTLKNGRSATVQIEGNYAGEWETSDASKYADEFDSFALQRDAIIAKRLQNADYDKYYDRDEYGAEDLSEYGEWVFTKKYGYVWKPFHNSIASYSDWSPYRYGQWRWIPQYGWAWVNDEPWGWATYHHGRWIYDDDDWYWSPYAYQRGRRSWWHPALVVVSYIGSNICWYPLPYDYNYYNYNSYYIDRRTTIINNTTVVVNPTPTPRIPTLIVPKGLASRQIPPTGVTSVPLSEFGRGKGRFSPLPLETAKKVLAETPNTTPPVLLPTIKDLNGKLSREIKVEKPNITPALAQIKTGATTRTSGVSADENLRQERVLGNRQPKERINEINNPPTQIKGRLEAEPPVRDTGAIQRQTRIKQNGNSETPNENPTEISPNRNLIRSTGGRKTGDENESKPPSKTLRNREISPPVYEPSPKREEPKRIEPRREQEPPRQEQQPPRQEQSPPKSETPRPQPAPPKSEPPKPEPKPVQPATEGKKNNKDG